MKHATEPALDRLEPLLGELRDLDGLKERKRGNFQLRSRAFLHFHEHGQALFADVRLDEDFERREVTTDEQRDALVAEIRERLARP